MSTKAAPLEEGVDQLSQLRERSADHVADLKQPKDEPIDDSQSTIVRERHALIMEEVMLREKEIKEEEMMKANLVLPKEEQIDEKMDFSLPPLTPFEIALKEDTEDVDYPLLPNDDKENGMNIKEEGMLNIKEEEMLNNDVEDGMTTKEEETLNNDMNEQNEGLDSMTLNEGSNEDTSDIPKDSSETAEVRVVRRRSSRISAMIKKGSGEDIEDSAKKMRSDSEERRNKKGSSSVGGVSDSETNVKKSRLTKRSDTGMDCPECEFHTNSVFALINHLRRKHSTTPKLVGLVIRCECGQAVSYKHSLTCDIDNFTAIQSTTTPQKCTLCDIFPTTPMGYIVHLNRHHKSTLNANGIYLKCACGFQFCSVYSTKHHKECDHYEFTVHKLEEK